MISTTYSTAPVILPFSLFLLLPQPFSQAERRVCLVRKDVGGLLLGPQKRKKKEAVAAEPAATVLGPGHMTVPARRPVGGSSSKKAVATADEPLADRMPPDLAGYLKTKGATGKWGKK